MRSSRFVHIIGGGLAGTEAALQLATRDVGVVLYEMRPNVETPAHKTSMLAELVCSNSLKSDVKPSPQALLKEELRTVGSVLLGIAEQHSVPAGRALAVDRVQFSSAVTELVQNHPLITLCREEVKDLSGISRPLILATGPLTSPLLASSVEARLGARSLYFYDAISPIIDAGSIDFSYLFQADRYGEGSGDYWNIPLDRAEYGEFVSRLRGAEPVVSKEWEHITYFESCLPVEEMARRGDDVLAFGPFRPVGLRNDAGKRPYAVIQLRRENVAGDCYNLVGCQTRLPFHVQRELFRALPGLEQARFLRYGQLHRNTYLDSPRLLTSTLALRDDGTIRIVGQLCGTEGYVESIGTGLLSGIFCWREIQGNAAMPPPRETMLGALCQYVSDAARPFQPMNAHYGLLGPPPASIRGRKARRQWLWERAMGAIQNWRADFILGAN